MIYLFTDFGWSGPYVGEMKAVIARAMPSVSIIDLMHDAPMFAPQASAYLLAALSKRFVTGGICLGVVDPGVGNPARRVLLLEADGIRYVGPDNGLFAVVAQRAKTLSCHEILWRPENVSVSFHGRDLFAPVVTSLYMGQQLESRSLSSADIVGAEMPTSLAKIIYVDHYGNAITGLDTEDLPSGAGLMVAGQRIEQARTFSSVAQGQLFWYINSMGLVEIAANCASAASKLGLTVGSGVEIAG